MRRIIAPRKTTRIVAGLLVEEAAQVVGARGVAQLAQRFRFDLADTLARYVELLADFFERVIGIHVDTETHAQYLGFACREASEYLAGGLAQAFAGGGVDWRCNRRVFDEVAEMRVFIVTDRGLHRDRFFSDLQDLANFVFRHLHALAKFFRRRFAAHLLQHLPRDTVELVDRFDHVYRDANRARLVGDGARNRLANPPRGICREFVAATVFEFIDCFHQADIAFLNQIEELQAATGVFFCN